MFVMGAIPGMVVNKDAIFMRLSMLRMNMKLSAAKAGRDSPSVLKN